MKVAKRGVFDRFRTLTDREEGFGGLLSARAVALIAIRLISTATA